MKENFNMLRPTSTLFPYIIGSAVTAVVFFFTDYLWVAILSSTISISLIFIILIGIVIELGQDKCVHKKHTKKNDIKSKKRLPH